MAGDVHELDLKTEAKGYGGRHNLRLGADYDFGKKNLLSVVYNTQYRYGQDCTKMRGTAHSDKTDDGDRQLHNVAADYQSSFLQSVTDLSGERYAGCQPDIEL